jgi:DNA-binding LacI/PurR family transcriptional regulator
MRATREDVAKLAGVSTATVSNVLNGTKPVSLKLEKKVIHAVEALGYATNKIARTMKTNQSFEVGLLLSNLENPIYSEFVKGFEQAAQQQKYSVSICTAMDDPELFTRKILSNVWDGVLIEPIPNQYYQNMFRKISENGVKIALFSHTDFDFDNISLIHNDYDSAMRDILTYLKSLGHISVAYVDGLGPIAGSHEMRNASFRSHCNSMGLRHTIIYPEVLSALTLESGYSLGPVIERGLTQFTAIITTNDLLAIGISTYLQEHGIAIPQDLSIVGFDDNLYCKYCSPKLSSVHADFFELGKLGFLCLYDNIIGKGIKSYTIPMQFIPRQSTARPRG